MFEKVKYLGAFLSLALLVGCNKLEGGLEKINEKKLNRLGELKMVH